jgi:hypothetical protein
VEGHVVRGGVQELRVVLELAETAVAVEAQERSHRARVVVVIDVDRRSELADRT